MTHVGPQVGIDRRAAQATAAASFTTRTKTFRTARIAGTAVIPSVESVLQGALDSGVEVGLAVPADLRDRPGYTGIVPSDSDEPVTP